MASIFTLFNEHVNRQKADIYYETGEIEILKVKSDENIENQSDAIAIVGAVSLNGV